MLWGLSQPGQRLALRWAWVTQPGRVWFAGGCRRSLGRSPRSGQRQARLPGTLRVIAALPGSRASNGACLLREFDSGGTFFRLCQVNPRTLAKVLRSFRVHLDGTGSEMPACGTRWGGGAGSHGLAQGVSGSPDVGHGVRLVKCQGPGLSLRGLRLILLCKAGSWGGPCFASALRQELRLSTGGDQALCVTWALGEGGTPRGAG